MANRLTIPASSSSTGFTVGSTEGTRQQRIRMVEGANVDGSDDKFVVEYSIDSGSTWTEAFSATSKSALLSGEIIGKSTYNVTALDGNAEPTTIIDATHLANNLKPFFYITGGVDGGYTAVYLSRVADLAELANVDEVLIYKESSVGFLEISTNSGSGVTFHYAGTGSAGPVFTAAGFYTLRRIVTATEDEWAVEFSGDPTSLVDNIVEVTDTGTAGQSASASDLVIGTLPVFVMDENFGAAEHLVINVPTEANREELKTHSLLRIEASKGKTTTCKFKPNVGVVIDDNLDFLGEGVVELRKVATDHWRQVVTHAKVEPSVVSSTWRPEAILTSNAQVITIPAASAVSVLWNHIEQQDFTTTLDADGKIISVSVADSLIGDSIRIKTVTTTEVTNVNVTVSNLDTSLSATDVAVAAADIDWSLGIQFQKTMTEDTTFTFSNVVAGKSIVIELDGNFTPTGPTGMRAIDLLPYEGTKTNYVQVYCISKTPPVFLTAVVAH